MTVFGDSAYADGATLDKLAEAGHKVFAKVPPVRNAKGYSKDEFSIDPDAGTVDLSGRAHRTDPGPARRRRPGPLHPVVRRLPAARGLHHRTRPGG